MGMRREGERLLQLPGRNVPADDSTSAGPSIQQRLSRRGLALAERIQRRGRRELHRIVELEGAFGAFRGTGWGGEDPQC